MSRMYNQNGSFGNNGVKLPEHYNVPAGNPMYFGRQESLLNTMDNPTFVGYGVSNLPSPYSNPSLNYGIGPQAANVTQEVLSAPNKNAFWDIPVLRAPTRDNPMMNVMPLDYDMNPLFSNYEKTVYPGTKSMETRDQIKNKFEDGLIQDADSLLFQRLNSQRQYVSMPVGSVPSDQGEFASWLYAPAGGVCKSGSIYSNYGVQYTKDSLLCTGFNRGGPIMSNKGLLNDNLMSSVEGGGM